MCYILLYDVKSILYLVKKFKTECVMHNPLENLYPFNFLLSYLYN